jgi:hypothetical protein
MEMEQYSNFITPPDFVKDDFPTVLIIDSDWVDIESVALWCKTAPKSYNIYIYSDIMLDEVWLLEAINSSHAVIINMENSAVDHIKRQLIKAPNCWYYGSKKFLGNSQHIDKPINWFINDNS